MRLAGRGPRWAVWAAFALASALVVSGGVAGYWYTGQVNPAGDPGAAITFTVAEDDTLETVSTRLEAEGLVTRAWLFRWYVERHGGLELTPGYFQLRPSDHMGNLMSVLATPPSETYTNITFPEGFTLEQMAERLADKMPRLTAAEFLEAATDGSVVSGLGTSGATSLEGLLFPDTYQVSNGESVRQVLQRMVSLMERVGAQEDVAKGYGALGLSSPYEVLVVASMIEREAKVDDDRAKIARVIYNRLYVGMELGIDATLYYGQPADTPFSELKALDTPYNTYLYKGLPPTPIAAPGRASIEAAMNPAPNPSLGDPLCAELPDGTPCLYLYYVIADEEGGHAFAATLEQHEANIEAARQKGLL
ncbi:MAG: hypothetical protein RLZ04_1272 [Actinomycetota bacterium]